MFYRDNNIYHDEVYYENFQKCGITIKSGVLGQTPEKHTHCCIYTEGLDFQQKVSCRRDLIDWVD